MLRRTASACLYVYILVYSIVSEAENLTECVNVAARPTPSAILA